MTNKKKAPLAQLVEHLTLNQGVQGSNPWRRIKYRFWRHMSSGVGAFFVFQLTRPYMSGRIPCLHEDFPDCAKSAKK